MKKKKGAEKEELTLFPRAVGWGTLREEKTREEEMQGEERPEEKPLPRGREGNSSLSVINIFEKVPIPGPMRTGQFIRAWTEWIEYRIEAGKEMRWPITKLCFRMQLRKCSKWGPERAIAAIDHSIEMGYRGIWEHIPPEWTRNSPPESKYDKWVL